MKIFLATTLSLICSAALAEGYMLPKSFSIKQNDLPPMEEKMREVKTTAPENTANTDISLTNLIQNYKYDYASTFKSTLNVLFQLDITPTEYDTNSGQIKARLASGKEIFILLLPSQEKLTHVRITPADGHYNIPVEVIYSIFKSLDRSLYSGV